MRITYTGNGSGAEQWRLEHPFKYMAKEGWEIVRGDGIQEYDVANSDVFVLQGCVDEAGIHMLRAYQKQRGLKIVVDVDDYLEVDESNPRKIQHEKADAVGIIKDTLGIADMVTTTTPELREYLLQFNSNVVVLPNYMDLEYWDGPIFKNDSNEVRVGWVGSITHFEDIKCIRKTLIEIGIDHPEVKFIFMGDLRMRDLLKGLNAEVMLGVPFQDYASRLRGLRLDIGIAPLQENVFNTYKSGIKVLEYGICGVPCIATRFPFYQRIIEDGVDGYVAYRYIDWWAPLESLITNKRRRRRFGEKMREKVVKDYNLADKIYLWLNAYNSLWEQNSKQFHSQQPVEQKLQ